MDPPGPEYETIKQCYPKLVRCLQQSPEDVEIWLIPLDILAPGDVEFLKNAHNNDDKKAQRIADIVMNQTEADPNVFHKFVKALKDAGPWTRNTVPVLEKTYDSFTNKSLKNQENSSSQTQTTLTPLQSHGKLSRFSAVC